MADVVVADMVVADMVCGRYGTDPQQTLRDHVIRVGAPSDMPVYFPAFAGTKLYCLVLEAVIIIIIIIIRQLIRRRNMSIKSLQGRRTTCLRLLRSSVVAGPRTRDS